MIYKISNLFVFILLNISFNFNSSPHILVVADKNVQGVGHNSDNFSRYDVATLGGGVTILGLRLGGKAGLTYDESFFKTPTRVAPGVYQGGYFPPGFNPASLFILPPAPNDVSPVVISSPNDYFQPGQNGIVVPAIPGLPNQEQAIPNCGGQIPQPPFFPGPNQFPQPPYFPNPGQIPQQPFFPNPGIIPQQPSFTNPGQIPQQPLFTNPGQTPQQPPFIIPGQIPQQPSFINPGQIPQNPVPGGCPFINQVVVN